MCVFFLGFLGFSSSRILSIRCNVLPTVNYNEYCEICLKHLSDNNYRTVLNIIICFHEDYTENQNKRNFIYPDFQIDFSSYMKKMIVEIIDSGSL